MSPSTDQYLAFNDDVDCVGEGLAINVTVDCVTQYGTRYLVTALQGAYTFQEVNCCNFL
jgi:hypothetical protein